MLYHEMNANQHCSNVARKKTNARVGYRKQEGTPPSIEHKREANVGISKQL